MSHIQDIELPNGMVVTARIGSADAFDDHEDVGFTETARAKVEQLQELITAVGGTVLDAARAAGPSEAAITFGVELTAKEGLAVAVLARGEAKASLQVTLTWSLDREADRAQGPAGA
ncbi:CU044_2847 family protein [Streptomyces sp. NPDC002309]